LARTRSSALWLWIGGRQGEPPWRLAADGGHGSRRQPSVRGCAGDAQPIAQNRAQDHGVDKVAGGMIDRPNLLPMPAVLAALSRHPDEPGGLVKVVIEPRGISHVKL
jgi:hypothetical protein